MAVTERLAQVREIKLTVHPFRMGTDMVGAVYGIRFAPTFDRPTETMVGEMVFDGEGNAIGWIVNATVGKDIECYDGSRRRGTVAILQGGRKPDEVMFVHDDGGVTNYLPEDAGMCKNIGHDTFVCSECGAHVQITNVGRSYLDENGKRWYSTSNEHKFRHCPNCGKQIVEEESE